MSELSVEVTRVRGAIFTETPAECLGVCRVIRVACVLVIAVFFVGCGTLPSGRAWGERAIYPVNWTAIPRAAKDAALDPVTWTPLLGAGAIAAGDWDDKISHWAANETPIFGSRQTAQDYSDIARDLLYVETLGTALLTPSGNEPTRWLWNKTRGLAVEAGAVGLTNLLTSRVKDATDRERPDRSDELSFPSGHASGAFSATDLINQHLDYIRMSSSGRSAWKAANLALATSVAWARVEGKKHFPTDVLVGAALGNFTTRFIHDAFIGTTRADRITFQIAPSLTSTTAVVSVEF